MKLLFEPRQLGRARMKNFIGFQRPLVGGSWQLEVVSQAPVVSQAWKRLLPRAGMRWCLNLQDHVCSVPGAEVGKSLFLFASFHSVSLMGSMLNPSVPPTHPTHLALMTVLPRHFTMYLVMLTSTSPSAFSHGEWQWEKSLDRLRHTSSDNDPVMCRQHSAP